MYVIKQEGLVSEKSSDYFYKVVVMKSLANEYTENLLYGINYACTY